MSKVQEGLSLTDIGAISTRIELPDGRFLKINGLSVQALVSLFNRYPDLRKVFLGGAGNVNEMLSQAPDAMAAIIASVCGKPEDAESEEIAKTLPIEVQFDIIETAMGLSFKRGFGPFVQRLASVAGSLAALNSGKAADTVSPPQ